MKQLTACFYYTVNFIPAITQVCCVRRFSYSMSAWSAALRGIRAPWCSKLLQLVACLYFKQCHWYHDDQCQRRLNQVAKTYWGHGCAHGFNGESQTSYWPSIQIRVNNPLEGIFIYMKQFEATHIHLISDRKLQVSAYHTSSQSYPR